ncbi:MAG: NADH-quinone oxidoreductase subunit J [bacterium]
MELLHVIVIWILGICAFAGAITMITHTHPIRAALGLLVTMLSLGVIYLLLSAPFVGFVQLTVYAGAIVVLFLLAMMNFSTQPLGPDPLAGLAGGGSIAIAVIAAAVLAAIMGTPLAANWAFVDGSPEGIGQVLLVPYVYVFELASVLLLIALVAAIYLTREDEPAENYLLDPDEVAAATPELP